MEALHAAGRGKAYLYGAPDAPGATGGLGHLGAFFLLTERPGALQPAPCPHPRLAAGWRRPWCAGLAAVAGLAMAAFALLATDRD